MEANQHTPGPWLENGWYVISEGGDDVCHVHEAMQTTRAANARLIASAPELLAALQVAVATIERLATVRNGFSSANGTLDVARAAIAKATGVRQ